MRRVLRFVLVLVGCLAAGAVSPAGVYNSAEKPVGPAVGAKGAGPVPFDLFMRMLGEQRQLRVENPVPKSRQHNLDRAAELRAKVRSGSATIDDKINLAAYLIELGQFDEAARLLDPEARDPANRGQFRLFANLATAYFQQGILDRAADYQREALANWPKQAPGFTPEQLLWYKDVEKQLFRLIMLRKAEQAKASRSDQVDALFDIEFVGESGQFEAGKLAAAQKEKLPPQALAQVQQLVLWFPTDNRLYWLLGEILNAGGNPEDAAKVLEDSIWARQNNSPVLRAHRVKLEESLASVKAIQTAVKETTAALDDAWAKAAGGLPGVGKLAAVALGVVAFIALFVYLQLREMRRRRLRAQNAGQRSM